MGEPEFDSPQEIAIADLWWIKLFIESNCFEANCDRLS